MLRETSEEFPRAGPEGSEPATEIVMSNESGAMDIAENGRRAEVLSHDNEGGLDEGNTNIDNGQGKNGHGKAKGTRKIQMPQMNLPAEASSLNLQFILTFSGIIKIGTIILAFICYICTLSSFARLNVQGYDGLDGVQLTGPGIVWTQYAIWTSIVFNFLVTLIYVAFPHQLQDARNVKGLLFVEMICAALAAIIFLIAGCVMADWAAKVYFGAEKSGAAIACILCFILMAVCGLGAFHYFTQWSGTNPMKKTQAKPQTQA